MWRWVAFGAVLTLVSCHLMRVAAGAAGFDAPEALVDQTVDNTLRWVQWACWGVGTLAAGETTRRVVRHHRRRKAAAAKPPVS